MLKKTVFSAPIVFNQIAINRDMSALLSSSTRSTSSPRRDTLAAVGEDSREKMNAVVRAWETQGKKRLRLISWVDPNIDDIPEAGDENDIDSNEEDDEDDDESTGSLRDFIVDDEDDEEDVVDENEDDDKDDETEVAILDDDLVDDSHSKPLQRPICVVCEERECNVCIDPCGHAMFCYACLTTLHQKALREHKPFCCPSCRGNVGKVLKIYHG